MMGILLSINKQQSAARDVPPLVDQEKNRLTGFNHRFMSYDQADES
jgi:hypothetical protein